MPSLPTDNLYKFQALTGLTIIVLTVWFLANQLNGILLQCIDSVNDLSRLSVEMSFLKEDVDKLEKKVNQLAAKTGELKKQTIYSTNDLSLSESNSMIGITNSYDSQGNEMIKEYTAMIGKNRELRLKRIEIEGKEYLINWEKSKFGVLAIVGFLVIGGSLYLAIIGFKRWYNRIQVYEDRILKNEAEKRLKK